MRRIMGLFITGGILLFFSPGVSRAGTIVFSGSTTAGGFNYSAEVDFTQSGNVLTVVLKNLDTTKYGNTSSDHLAPGQVLTGVFFSIAGVTSLSDPSSAAGTLLNNSGKNVVADGWAYSTSTLKATPGGSLGIVSSGYSDPGHANFQGQSTKKPLALDGYGFGIVGSGYTAGNRINGDTPGQVVVDLAATFTVTLPSSTILSANDFGSVSFQYGTSLSEQNVPGIQSPTPEPASLTLLGIGIAGLGAYGWRRSRKPAVA
jgi:hypothetical protein